MIRRPPRSTLFPSRRSSDLIILSEIGLDMSRWRSEKAFCSWLGLCPGNKISGGKVLTSHTAHVVNRVAILLRTVDRKSTRLNSSHSQISYAVFCLEKKDSAT